MGVLLPEDNQAGFPIECTASSDCNIRRWIQTKTEYQTSEGSTAFNRNGTATNNCGDPKDESL